MFVKISSIFKFVFFLGSKEAIGKISLTLDAPNRILGLVVKWRHHTNSLYIGHFGKYHNTFCLSPQILHKHCFPFLLGLTMVPRENKNNPYAKFGETNKEYYGIFRSGLFVTIEL